LSSSLRRKRTRTGIIATANNVDLSMIGLVIVLKTVARLIIQILKKSAKLVDNTTTITKKITTHEKLNAEQSYLIGHRHG
jgi:hypothetical protein